MNTPLLIAMFSIATLLLSGIIGCAYKQKKNLLKQLNHVLHHDTLTGLPNRVLFNTLIQSALDRATDDKGRMTAVLFIDLDRFKLINDSLGHLTGDKILQAIARRLVDHLRPHDVLARFSGDEFVVLLENIGTEKAATQCAQRLQQALARPFTLAEHSLFCHASIGISLKQGTHHTPEDFLRDADTAVYHAKSAGHSCYVLFDASMQERAHTLLSLENELRRAITEQQLLVFYQPIIDFETGRIISFEALVRWLHPTKGLLTPDHFLSIAEDIGLLKTIDDWVLSQAIAQLHQWQKTFPTQTLSMNINASCSQILHGNLVNRLAGLLSEYPIRQGSLNMEITETALLEDSEPTLAVLKKLSEFNIGVHLDDFGTGYSSLSYLYRFPIDTIKIDGAFIQRMHYSQKDLAIVQSIILLAKHQHMEVTAEGIQTRKQYDRLKKMHCTKAQGYFLSKPLPAHSINKLLTKNRVRLATAV